MQENPLAIFSDSGDGDELDQGTPLHFSTNPSYNQSYVVNSGSSDSTVSQELIDPAATFHVEFSNGYSLRNLIEYLRLTNLRGTFRFYEDRIVYDQSSAAKDILNYVVIEASELTDYTVQSKTGVVVITVNLAELRTFTKTIAKKDRATLSKMSNDPNLYLQVFSSNANNIESKPSLYTIQTMRPEIAQYTRSDFQRDEKHPNCTVEQSDFAKMCASVTITKCTHVIIYGFEKGMRFKGMSSSNQLVSCKEFGKCKSAQSIDITTKLQSITDTISSYGNFTIKKALNPAPTLEIKEDGEIDSAKIPVKTIKALSKLNNLSTNGTIKMYMEPKRPLRLICNIGGYGKLTVYLKAEK